MRFNLDRRCAELQNYTNTVSNIQMGKKNVIILMGDDFTGANQYAVYKQVDALIEYCNNNQKTNMTFVYSTPSKYINALKEEQVKWPIVRNHDFMPYAREHNAYWSGFFSSRPGLKK